MKKLNNKPEVKSDAEENELIRLGREVARMLGIPKTELLFENGTIKYTGTPTKVSFEDGRFYVKAQYDGGYETFEKFYISKNDEYILETVNEYESKNYYYFGMRAKKKEA